MKKKILIAYVIGALVISLALATGCQETKVSSNASTDTFDATYNLVEEGRSINISGNSDGKPGEQSEYLLKIYNNNETWQDEYFVLLLDSNSVIQEISHKQFNIPAGGGIQTPVTVEFPESFKGALGLCVLIPQRASLITTLSVGVNNAIGTGWPDIRSYPVLKNKRS